VYVITGKRSIYQNVQLFIESKTDIRNIAIFNYSYIGSEKRYYAENTN